MVEQENVTTKNSPWKSTWKDIKDFYYAIGSKKSFWLPVVLLMVLAYGFSICNRTVSIDDLSRDYYNGESMAMIAATRWGLDLWVKLFSTSHNVAPFADKFLGAVFLFAASILICTVLYKINNCQQKVWTYTVVASVFVTYPLINEIWEYNGVNMIIGISFCIDAVAILYQLNSKLFSWKTIVISGILLSPVMAGYESLIFAYITFVLFVLFQKYCINKQDGKKSQWFLEGLSFALPLFVALFLRYAIGFGLIALNGLEIQPNGEKWISWGSDSVIHTLIWELIYGVFIDYFSKGLAYLPITIFVFAFVTFLGISVKLSISRKKVLPLILGGAIAASLFIQAIIQGHSMPYRSAQPLMLFVPLVVFLIVNAISIKTDGKRYGAFVSGLSVVLLMLLSTRQAVQLNQILALDNQRSENEIAIIQQLGFKLYSEFDISKTVVFVGNVDLGSNIIDQISSDEDSLWGKFHAWGRKIMGKEEKTFESIEYVIYNVNSMINFTEESFGGQAQMKTYFSYCGYEINTFDKIDDLQYEEYYAVAVENNMKPLEIKDMGEYILVCLGLES